ncbi:hypothetical protein K443DRAFT_678491 [Laccaria amethystina LaAM-08-1]|jgi:hypothetical protein|uniref:Uncharacterized protein n=1 Tax=Laccaria amethystina LaAM-08-1 TaxID=1095629 RepID=A0A0C9XZZ2_9AGAR|nr:hypothetical protein K443DRAFT_678491 [Laccaria amethystina LaAM-08-1]
MPFSTDLNWPQHLLDIFEISRNQNTSLDSRYYGAYDRLLNYAVVEGSFTFSLSRQAIPDETSPQDAVDFVVFMVVLNQEQKPVLIAEIKDDRWANTPYSRQRADTHMRQLYGQMLYKCAIPWLYGLSLLGTSLRVYCGDKDTGEVTPHYVGRPHVDRVLPLDFLEVQWDLDILSQDGLRKIQEIVAYIKAEAATV